MNWIRLKILVSLVRFRVWHHIKQRLRRNSRPFLFVASHPPLITAKKLTPMPRAILNLLLKLTRQHPFYLRLFSWVPSISVTCNGSTRVWYWLLYMHSCQPVSCCSCCESINRREAEILRNQVEDEALIQLRHQCAIWSAVIH